MDASEWFMIIFFLILVLFTCGIIGDAMNPLYSEIFVDNGLKTLQDESAIHGSFSIGSGKIDEEQIFAYYMIDGNGYVLRNVPSVKSKVIEDEQDKPFIRTYYMQIKGGVTGMITWKDKRYEFHVPKGTIIDEKYLDAKK